MIYKTPLPSSCTLQAIRHFFLFKNSLSTDPTTRVAAITTLCRTTLLLHVSSLLSFGITMSDNNSLPVLPALVPSLSGVPSSRHLVVIRRAEQHFWDLLDILTEMSDAATTGDEEIATIASYFSRIEKKVCLIDSSIEELERRTSRAKRAQITTRLEKLKTDLEEVRGIIYE
jgi:hypothetical protein